MRKPRGRKVFTVSPHTLVDTDDVGYRQFIDNNPVAALHSPRGRACALT